MAENIILELINTRLTGRLYRYFIRIYSKVMTWWCCGRFYETRIDPFNIIYIDPRDVEYKMTGEGKSYFTYKNNVCEVVDGRWDCFVEPIEGYYMYKSFVNHFEKGTPWTDTVFYNQVCSRIESGESIWGCENRNEFHHRLGEIESLYNNIKSNNYLTQKELRSKKTPDPASRTVHDFWPPKLNEVIINIDRNGNFILHDGRHRFIIAYILNIDQIPVRVKTRHKKWQLFRDSNNNQNIKHPDL